MNIKNNKIKTIALSLIIFSFSFLFYNIIQIDYYNYSSNKKNIHLLNTYILNRILNNNQKISLFKNINTKNPIIKKSSNLSIHYFYKNNQYLQYCFDILNTKDLNFYNKLEFVNCYRKFDKILKNN